MPGLAAVSGPPRTQRHDVAAPPGMRGPPAVGRPMAGCRRTRAAPVGFLGRRLAAPGSPVAGEAGRALS
ncbi:hypothetical protein ACU686_41155 [Yinghuangia aomiensis]